MHSPLSLTCTRLPLRTFGTAADLLQRYVEVSGDVQSVALCVALAYPQYVHDVNDPRFKAWIETCVILPS